MSLNVRWLLPSAAAVLYCINQLMAVYGIRAPTSLMAFIFLLVTVICAFNVRAYRFLPHICFCILLGFPEYSADPYLKDYVAPFSLAKFPALLALILMLRIRINASGILVGFLLLVSTLSAFLAGRLGNLSAEIAYAVFLILALNTTSPLAGRAKLIWLDAMERMFYLLLPIAVFSEFAGIYEQRSTDTTTYFYGHWVGIVSALAIYRAAVGDSRLFNSATIRYSLIIVTVYVCAASYQSVHYVFFVAAAAFALAKSASSRGNSRNIAASIVVMVLVPAFMYLVLSTYSADSWVYLKLSQIAALTSGSFLESSNSVTIRVAQLVSLFEQGGWPSIVAGRGLASTYLAEGSLWEFVVFHEATYPEGQLLSGQLQYIHESVTMLLKWVGLAGLFVVLYSIGRRLNSIGGVKGVEGFSVLMFLFLFASSLNTGIIVTLLLVFCLGSKPCCLVADKGSSVL